MKVRFLLVAAASVGLLAAVVTAGERISLEGVKCVVLPDANAKAETAADYNGGKVFFCCNGCAAKFKKDPAKYAVRANYQLVATKQAKQVHCPLTGGPCKAETKLKVGGVEVCFCCPNCQGKVSKAEGDAQLALVFSDEAFKKGFKVGDKDKKQDN